MYLRAVNYRFNTTTCTAPYTSRVKCKSKNVQNMYTKKPSFHINRNDRTTIVRWPCYDSRAIWKYVSRGDLSTRMTVVQFPYNRNNRAIMCL